MMMPTTMRRQDSGKMWCSLGVMWNPKHRECIVQLVFPFFLLLTPVLGIRIWIDDQITRKHTKICMDIHCVEAPTNSFFSKSILYRKGNRLDPKDPHNFAGSGFKTFSTDPDLNTFASYIFFLQTITLNVQILKRKGKRKKLV